MEPGQMNLDPEDIQMLEAFKRMANHFQQSTDEDIKDAKKQKKHQAPDRTDPDPASMQRLLKAMGTLLLKVDSDLQTLRKQDCWVCYLRTGQMTLLEGLIQGAQTWQAKMKELKSSQTQTLDQIPLRCHLFQTFVKMLQTRVQKLASSSASDPLVKAALENGTLCQEGFPFQKWNSFAKCLQTTSQKPVSLPRMCKYMDQLVELSQDPANVVRFHSMKAPAEVESMTVVPWMLQVSLRYDDLQLVLTQLLGNTVFALVGLSMRPHSLTQSKQAEVVKELMGKSSGKGKTKGKGVVTKR